MGKVSMQYSTETCQVKKIYIGDFGTPYSSHTKKPKRNTEVVPFSFDQRDQEMIQRKLARLKQVTRRINYMNCNNTLPKLTADLTYFYQIVFILAE